MLDAEYAGQYRVEVGANEAVGETVEGKIVGETVGETLEVGAYVGDPGAREMEGNTVGADDAELPE